MQSKVAAPHALRLHPVSLKRRSLTACLGGVVWATVLLLAMQFWPAGIVFLLSANVLLLALGWGLVVDAPSPLACGISVFITGMSTLIVMTLKLDMSWAFIAFAFCLPLAFWCEILRGKERSQVARSLTCSVSGCLVAVFSLAWLFVPLYPLFRLLSFIVLPTIAVGILSLLIPVGHHLLRFLIQIVVSLITVFAVMLFDYSKVSNSLFYIPVHQKWIIITGITLWAFFAALLVYCIDYYFPAPIIHQRKLPALLFGILPVIMAAAPLYAFSRFVMG